MGKKETEEREKAKAGKEEEEEKVTFDVKNKELQTTIDINLWKTDHAKKVMLGIKKFQEYRAKSMQFTKDMHLCGEVKIDNKTEGYLGIRDIFDSQRIIIKLFSESINWYGTIEEVLARGVAQSLAFGSKPRPSFSINLNRTDYLVQLERYDFRTAWKKLSFFLINEKSELECILLQSKIGFGDDYVVKSMTYGDVASVDGKALDIGGRYVIKIYHPELAKNKVFIETLILALAAQKYSEYAEKRVKAALEKDKSKSEKVVLDEDEIKLYYNPRRIKA